MKSMLTNHSLDIYKCVQFVTVTYFIIIFVLTVTEPPRLKAGETEAQIPVPALAANSKVGFKDTVVTVNEGEVNCHIIWLKPDLPVGPKYVPKIWECQSLNQYIADRILTENVF